MKRNFLLLIGSLLLFCLPSMAQCDTCKKGLEAFKAALDKPNPRADSLSKYNYELEKQKLLTESAEQRYFQRQYDFYYTSSLQHRFDTFQWQQVSGKIIFWVVIIIVFIALLFAAIQFRISMQQASSKIKKAVSTRAATVETGETTEAGASAMPNSEVELSVSGVKVNSSVLGVVILVISLAFLYLYLVYVYPISSVKTDGISNPAKELVE